MSDARVDRLRAMIGEVVARDRRRPPPAPKAPAEPPLGETRETPHGAVHFIDEVLEPGHAHGRIPVRGALDVAADVMAMLALDPALGDVDPKRMLVLDTETTGLSTGAGTVPFLVGLAWFEDGALRLEQLFLRDLGTEVPMLRHLAERLAEASVLVTYNGKSFDWPLLRTRFVLNRVAAPALPPHFDVLFAARRLLRGKLDSMRLTEVERGLLGYYREDDVDGSEIPGLYLGYLRGENPDALRPVLEHNADDLVALPAIVGELGARVAKVREADDPRDVLACAQLAVRARDTERAIAFARAVIEGGADDHAAREAHALVADVERRRGRAAQAAEAWHAALEAVPHGPEAGEAHLALAKLYEHRLRDLPRAQLHAWGTEPAEGEEANGKRLGRLRRRLDRAGS